MRARAGARDERLVVTKFSFDNHSGNYAAHSPYNFIEINSNCGLWGRGRKVVPFICIGSNVNVNVTGIGKVAASGNLADRFWRNTRRTVSSAVPLSRTIINYILPITRDRVHCHFLHYDASPRTVRSGNENNSRLGKETLISDKGLEIFEPRFTSLRENVSYVRLDLADVVNAMPWISALNYTLQRQKHPFSKTDERDRFNPCHADVAPMRSVIPFVG